MAIKLILTDIDGTILPYGKKTVTHRCVDAFHAAMDAGILVGPASGRFYPWIPEFFGGDASCCATAIATNGSQVYLEGKKALQKEVDSACVRRAMEVLSGVDSAGLLLFEGEIPYLVQGSRDDLLVCFPRYGETCIERDDVPSAGITKADAKTDYLLLTSNISSANVPRSFYGFELGVYAKGADGKEQLYAYRYAETDVDFYPAADAGRTLELTMSIVVQVGNAKNVTAVLVEGEAYARADHKHSTADITSGVLPVERGGQDSCDVRFRSVAVAVKRDLARSRDGPINEAERLTHGLHAVRCRAVRQAA